MKKINIILLSLVVVLSTIGCKKTLDDIDTDPNNVTSTNIKTLMPSVTIGVPFNISGTDLSWYASIFCEQTAGVHGQMLDTELRRDGVTPNSFNNSWLYAYPGILKDIDIIIEKGNTEENNKTASGIGKVLKAYTYSILVSLFGDIPYSQALKYPEIKDPAKFDKEEFIYVDLLKLLDEAIDDLSKNQGIVQNEDFIFGGSRDKWTKTAWALKARIMNRVIGKITDPSITNDNILDAISKSFSNSSDNFSFNKYTTAVGWQNTWFAVETQRGHHSISKTFFLLLKGKNDPRLYISIDTSSIKKNLTGYDLEGKESGTATNDQGKNLFPKISDKILSATSPMPMITYAEIKLIEAETLERKGTNGKTAFDEGVRASLEAFSVSNADITAYIGNLPANPSLQDIIEQKYIALWPFGSIEAYCEYRRTGFPNLRNALNSTQFPQRYRYPEVERQANPNTPEQTEATIYNSKLIFAK